MESVSQIFREIGTQRLLIIGGVLIAVIVGIITLIFNFSSPTLSPLYSNLDMKDSARIVTELEGQGIPYEIRANGTQIYVPDNKVLRLRMTMAEKGIPSKGSLVGYEIFDSSETLGTSNFVQNVNLLRALEGELGRTIGAFSQIESARVHLVLPKRELFSRDKQETTASVVVKMKGGSNLSREEINAISHLVATAVPGLEVSKITIVDTEGKPFKLGSRDENDPGMMASNAEDYRVSYEKRMRSTVEELLERSLGAGRVKVQVNADINFDRVVTNSEIYDPDGQVVRSIQAIEEEESSNEKDGQNNVSIATNLPNSQSSGAANQSASNSRRSDETTNYEISKTIKNHISEAGTIKRLSIAVLVDGNYLTNDATGEVTYQPRSNEELQKIESLVKSAVGFDEVRKDSIEVVNMQFTTNLASLKGETMQDWFKREFASIVQTIVIAVVVILVILLVIRPIVIRAFEMGKNESDDLLPMPEINPEQMLVSPGDVEDENQETLIDIERLESKFKSSTVKSVNEVVNRYPQETLNIIRKWFHEE